jgi:hypothetical protein
MSKRSMHEKRWLGRLAHTGVSPDMTGSIDVPTIEAISGLKQREGVYTSCRLM